MDHLISSHPGLPGPSLYLTKTTQQFFILPVQATSPVPLHVLDLIISVNQRHLCGYIQWHKR